MNSESEQKEIFRKAFEEKQLAFIEYQKNEDKTIQDKVQKELKSYLALTAEKALQLEKEKREIEGKLSERTYMLKEIDGLSIGQHKAICASEKKEKMQDSIIENLKGQIGQLETKVGLQEGEVAEKDSRVKNLESENEKLVGAILKLGDVRTVVNRVWDKEDNSQKVVNKLKNEDYLPQFDQGSSQYGSQANMRSMQGNGNNQGYAGGNNVNKSWGNNAGDDFWYNEPNGGDPRKKLEPMPNQHASALKEPTFQGQGGNNLNHSGMSGGGGYRTQNNRMHNEYGSTGNYIGNVNKKPDYNYYD